MDPTNTSISDTCDKVIDYYQQCMQRQDTYQRYKLIKTEYDRLKIWAGSIGVYSRPPASADDRLREDFELRVLVIELLTTLFVQLRRYVSINNDFTHAEVSSSSSEDTSSTSSREDEGDRAQTLQIQDAFTRLLHRVRRVNSRLFSVLTLVRQPTHLTSNEKVFHFDYEKRLGAEKYKELIEDFEAYVEFYLNHTFKSDHVSTTSTLSKAVFMKLKKGAIIRRKALILKERHKRKLRTNLNTKFKAHPYHLKEAAFQAQMIEQRRDQPQPTSVVLSRHGSIELSETVPSVAIKRQQKGAENVKIQPAPKSSKSRILLRGKLDVPRPPHLEENELEVDCYICGLMLDRTSLADSRWSKHVLEDIDAFICLFECDKPDILYKTPEDWYGHMQKHRMQWGCMTPAHAHLTFDSKTDLETHLKADHPSKLSQSQIELLSGRGQRPLSAIFEACPLCGRNVNDLRTESPTVPSTSVSSLDENSHARIRALQRHVESHMYEIALLSILPNPELAAMSESVAGNEDLKDIMNDSSGIRLTEADLVSLPRDIESPQQPRRFDPELSTAISYGQVGPPFLDSQTHDASEQWAVFLENQRPPPDVDAWLDIWLTICEEIQKIGTQARDDNYRWRNNDKTLLANLQSSIREKAGCAQDAQLSLLVEEGLCTNKEIVRAIRAAANPVDIVIAPPAADGHREVTLLFLNVEDAKTAFADLDEFQLYDIAIPVQSVYTVAKTVQYNWTSTTALGKAISYAQAQHLPISMRDRLQIPDTSEELIAARQVAHSDIGNHLLETRVFKDWLKGDNSFLWLHGPPGQGKSVHCFKIFEHTLHIQQLQTKIATAFFFFKYQDPWKQDATALLKAVLVQLSGQDTELWTELTKIEQLLLPSEVSNEKLLHCLKQMMQKCRHVYLVLDGLDECPTGGRRNDVLGMLSTMRQWSLPCLHLLVSSRTLVVIQSALPLRGAEEMFQLKGEDVDGDIERYVNEQLQNNVKLRKTKQYHSMIKEALTSRANGSFLWVVLQLTMLEQVTPNGNNIVKALDNLPSTLDKTFDRMLLNISPDLQDILRCILVLLCFAERVLTLAEINESLAVDLQAQCFDVKRRFENAGDILDICPGLLAFVQSDVSVDADFSMHGSAPINKQYVGLAHFSVRDYIVSGRTKSSSAVMFAVSESEGHVLIYMMCMIYLTQLPPDEHVSYRDIIERRPFTIYAARHWISHYKQAGDETISELTSQAYKLCTTKVLFERWVRFHGTLDDVLPDFKSDKASSSCYYLALHGLDQILAEVLDKSSAAINAQGGTYGNALQAASVRGYPKIVRMLLNHAAEINAVGGAYGTALQAASAFGHVEIVRMLLDFGADINMQGGSFGNALQAALANDNDETIRILLVAGVKLSSVDGMYGCTELFWASTSGHDATVRLLLEHGAQVDCVDNHLQTPLSLASEHGHVEVVKSLLERGAQVDSTDDGEHTPLCWASRGGYEAIVQILLASGAQVDSVDEAHRTPLSWAALLGHEVVVRSLLDHGAWTESVDDRGRPPLSYASDSGHEAVVRSLLESGAKINLLDHSGRSPLYYASRSGHETVVQLLLERGAQRTLVDAFDQSPLSVASRNGHEAVVRVLLEAHIRVDSVDNGGRSPLSYASEHGHETVVRLLLEHDTHVDMLDNGGRSSLSYASEHAHEAVVQSLLVHGAQIDLVDKEGLSPLHYASTGGHGTVARLLLEAGAHTDSVNKEGRSPLYYASRGGHETVVRLLLEHGAQTELVDGRPPLFVASEHGHEAIVRILLEGGARVDSVDGYGRSPLFYASQYDHQTVVRLLLEGGARIDLVDNGGRSSLSCASSSGHETIILLLLEGGASIDLVDKGGQSPLSHASEDGHEGVVRLLLKRGAYVDLMDHNRRSPLSHASQNGHENIVRLLLECGAHIDSVDGGDESTPIVWAISGGQDAVVRLLLDAGANVQAESKTYGSLLGVAAYEGHEQIVRTLLDRGATVNAKRQDSDTALIYASRFGLERIVQMLLNAGADVNQTGTTGTALKAASRRGHEEIIQLLLKAGARYDTTN